EEIVRVISRYQSRYRSIHWYGDHSFWVGNSEVLRQLDQRIDLLAKRNCPVLIRADKGTGKIIAARRLHDLTCNANAPFVESDCREWEEDAVANMLQSLRSCAAGGTLFLRNIDSLSAKSQQALRHFCLQWMAASRRGNRLGLVFSLSSAAIEPVEVGLSRSEEHTSELQSREKLVCRLLLAKKKPAGPGPRTAEQARPRSP